MESSANAMVVIVMNKERKKIFTATNFYCEYIEQINENSIVYNIFILFKR